MMKAGRRDRRYASVWMADPGFEAIPSYGSDPAAHLERCRELIQQGYRPVSFSVARTRIEGPLVASSAWRRPSVSEVARDALAERQARAAVARLRLGHTDALWPLLKHNADPRLRSFIVNGLSPLGADLTPLVTEFTLLNSPATRHAPPATQKMDEILFHPETSQRRALILALGTYKTGGLSLASASQWSPSCSTSTKTIPTPASTARPSGSYGNGISSRSSERSMLA